jgi:hypothetical protein
MDLQSDHISDLLQFYTFVQRRLLFKASFARCSKQFFNQDLWLSNAQDGQVELDYLSREPLPYKRIFFSVSLGIFSERYFIAPAGGGILHIYESSLLF